VLYGFAPGESMSAGDREALDEAVRSRLDTVMAALRAYAADSR
jgi:hypothetical protein